MIMINNPPTCHDVRMAEWASRLVKLAGTGLIGRDTRRGWSSSSNNSSAVATTSVPKR